MIGNKIDSVESISKYQKDDYKRDTILKDLGVLQPDKASYSSIELSKEILPDWFI